MVVNYILLLITGIYSCFGVVSWIRRSVSTEKLLTIACLCVFVLVLVATLMGMDYTAFRMLLEGR
jgi:drug/metabolite transporter superfamily protein YnfA